MCQIFVTVEQVGRGGSSGRLVFLLGLLGGSSGRRGNCWGGCAGGALRPHFACVFPL